MKKLMALLVTMIMAISLAACGAKETKTTEDAPAEAPAEASEEAPKEEGDAQEATGSGKTIGFVVAGPDDYYNVSAETVEVFGKDAGWNVVVLNSEYTNEKEISNFEDLIAMNVDGIMCIAANTESAQTATQLANEAGVPVVFVAGGPGEGAGVPDSFVTGNWTFAGEEHARYLNETMPDCKVALVGGVAGQGISNQITDAFKANFKGEIVAEQDCNWSREDAMSYTQDLISAGTEMDVIFAYNDEMAAGVQQALEEAGYQPGEVGILSNNGKPIGQQMLKDGWILYDIEFAPTSEAYIGALIMQAILEGKEVNASVENAAICLNANNIDQALTWEAEKFVKEDYQLLDMDAIMDAILK